MQWLYICYDVSNKQNWLTKQKWLMLWLFATTDYRELLITALVPIQSTLFSVANKLFAKYWLKQFHKSPSHFNTHKISKKRHRTHMGRVKRIWYSSPMRAAKVQASLRIRAVSPEPPLLAHTKQWVKRNLQTESQILSPSEWLGMRS